MSPLGHSANKMKTTGQKAAIPIQNIIVEERKSLYSNELEGIEINEEIKYPGQSQDIASNKAFEDFFSSIQVQKDNTQLPNTKPSSNSTQNGAPSILSNQIHQILYSKPMNFGDAGSDIDENDENDEVEQKQSNFYYSFDEPIFDDNKENMNINLEEEIDEQYDLTDYSSNSSSNENSYVYHEEDEEFWAVPNKQGNMFNFNFQSNDYDNVEPNTQIVNNGNHKPGMFSNMNKGGGIFAGIAPKSQDSQSSLFGDFFNNQKKQNLDFDPDIDRIQEKSVKKKRKRLYCSSKIIPLWATDLNEVKELSENQKKMINSNTIFGISDVDNLDLVEVFQIKNHRILKPRYFFSLFFLIS